MSTWLIVLLVIVGVLLLIGLIRAIANASTYRRCGVTYDVGDFFIDLLFIDLITDADWNWFGDVFGDSDID